MNTTRIQDYNYNARLQFNTKIQFNSKNTIQYKNQFSTRNIIQYQNTEFQKLNSVALYGTHLPNVYKSCPKIISLEK